MRIIYIYFALIAPGKLILWCYLLWYLTTLYYHFDASPMLWINSLGISAIIGSALMLSISRRPDADYWQTFRLYWMPFAVSSFSALIKDQDYFLIFSPQSREVAFALICCALLLAMVVIVKWSYTKREFIQRS